MTVLVAGGTGVLGPEIVSLLNARGLDVRILARYPQRAGSLKHGLVDFVRGDVRNPSDIDRAMEGCTTVISAISGFAMRGESPRSVDWKGNRNLIRAAQSHKVEHFILVSILNAAADHPADLFRMKYAAQKELMDSGLAWTVLSPTAYTESWGRLIWEPLLLTGKTRIFGRGDNPINFVSAQDVARLVELSIVDPRMRGIQVPIGGPEDLTMNQFLEIFKDVTGTTGKTMHISRPALRLVSTVFSIVNPRLARLARMALIMDSTNLTYDSKLDRQRFPSVPTTSVAEVAKRHYVDRIKKPSSVSVGIEPVGPGKD